MQSLLEFILGLNRGFLSRDGDLGVGFNPPWPFADAVGPSVWNGVLAILIIALVIVVYRREGRSRGVRISLGLIRAAILMLVLLLLNRPVLTLTQTRTEPSVLAVMIDDSVSMRIRDAITSSDGDPQSRLAAAVELLAGADQKFVKELSKTHELKFYRFASTAVPLPATTRPADALAELQPLGQTTQIGPSLSSVIDDLRGHRLAGIVMLTDGRDSPERPLTSVIDAVKESGTRVFAVPLGSTAAPRNVEVQSINAQDAAFKGDIVNIKVALRASGVPAGQRVTVRLKDRKSGAALADPTGLPVEKIVTIEGDAPTEVELQYRADAIGTLDALVEASTVPGEIDEEDNLRHVQIVVLDAKINVLYAEGYPRWEYRYLKNQMIRDASVNISCYLFSADPTFRQEGDQPITRFPESIEEMLDYDVVLFGDVDVRQFSDAQLQLVHDFVSKRGGGFGMVAGPRFAPQEFRNTPIEQLLPVNISRVVSDEARGTLTAGFRPVVTREGDANSVFRFFPDKLRNEKFLKEELQLLFWYCRGITTKPGVGEVYAMHPDETGPDGRKAPLLVFGRFGAGRTMFSAIDDSWRWRFYTGESVFDTYWIQQLRQLARSKKLGQRRVMLTPSRPSYELGEQVRLNMRILDPQMISQLPEQVRVDIRDEAGQVVRQESLARVEAKPDTFAGAFTADRIGRFVVALPAVVAGTDPIDLPIEVRVPRLELTQPQVDRVALQRLASETSGQVVEASEAREKLAGLIPSAARIIPIESSQPLWDAPLAMGLFVFLIASEWIARKLYGML